MGKLHFFIRTSKNLIRFDTIKAQPQNVLIFFLSSLKPSYLSTSKITPYVDNSLNLGDIGEIDYYNTTLKEYKVKYPDGISDYITKDDF